MDTDHMPPTVTSTATTTTKKKKKITTGERDWAELPWDALSVVFEKVGPFHVVVSAQQVCSQWWKLAHDPRVWKSIDFTGRRYDDDHFYKFTKIALALINRSNGGLEEFAFTDYRTIFYYEVYGTNDLLKRIAQTSTQLRVLRLINCGEVSEKALMKACQSFPLLEELEIINCMSLTSAAVESFGHSCPLLKKFGFHCTRTLFFSYSQLDNNGALAISKHMPELRELQLVGNKLDDNGLCALLDGCPYLELLNIRRCFHLVLGGNLKKRCQGLKFLRLPKGSIEDYPCSPYGYYDYDDFDDCRCDSPELYEGYQSG